MGTSVFNLLGQNGRVSRGIKVVPTEKLTGLLLKENVIMNPTVMFRRKRYDSVLVVHNRMYKFTHDYELWTRLALTKTLANIAEPLVMYRLNKLPKNSLSSKAPFRREVEVITIRSRYLLQLLLHKKFKLIYIRFYLAALYKQSIPSFLRIIHSSVREPLKLLTR